MASGGLRRSVGLFPLVTYGVGNIVGAGIYVLIGEAAGLAGNAAWLAFLLAAVVAVFTGLTYAELGAMYPKAASEYVYLGRAYGSRLLSFLTEWTMLVTEMVAAAAVALGFASYFTSVINVPEVPVAAGLLVGLTALTLLGIKGSLRVNTILSLAAIAGLVAVIAVGAPHVGAVRLDTAPNGLSGVVAAAGLVFFAYIGFDNVVNLSEEVKHPQRTVPRGLLISVAVSSVLYVLVAVAAVSLTPWQDLAASKAPLAFAASRAFGDIAFDVLVVIGLLTTLNTVLVLLLVSSRIIYGMAEERALPSILARVIPSTGAPYAASLVAMGVALAFLGLGSIGAVAKVTSFGSLVTFALVNLAQLHLRRVAPGMARPFKAPGHIGWLSITGLLGLLTCLGMLTQFDTTTALLSLAFPVSGVAVYVLFTRRNAGPGEPGFHEAHEG